MLSCEFKQQIGHCLWLEDHRNVVRSKFPPIPARFVKRRARHKDPAHQPDDHPAASTLNKRVRDRGNSVRMRDMHRLKKCLYWLGRYFGPHETPVWFLRNAKRPAPRRVDPPAIPVFVRLTPEKPAEKWRSIDERLPVTRDDSIQKDQMRDAIRDTISNSGD